MGAGQFSEMNPLFFVFYSQSATCYTLMQAATSLYTGKTLNFISISFQFQAINYYLYFTACNITNCDIGRTTFRFLKLYLIQCQQNILNSIETATRKCLVKYMYSGMSGSSMGISVQQNITNKKLSLNSRDFL